MTEHSKQRELVVALAAGELPESGCHEAERHLDHCSECRDWLETYSSFARALRDDSRRGLRHPASEELARFVVDPRSASPTAARRLGRHLEICEACRTEVELGRESVDGVAGGLDVRRNAGRGWRVAAAAAVVAAVVGLVLFTWHRGPSLPTPAAGEMTIANLAIAEARTIEADRVLVAETSRLLGGADVRLRAGEVVVLGEGFSVDSEAVLVVETRHQQ